MIAFGKRKKKTDDKSNKELTHTHSNRANEPESDTERVRDKRVSKESPMPKWK